MNEHILTTRVRRDEAETFLGIEPLDWYLVATCVFSLYLIVLDPT